MGKFTGRGGKLKIGSPPVEVAQVQSIGNIDITADETEVTTLDNTSGFRDFLQTFKDSGELPVTLVWDPVLPSHSDLWDLFIGGDTVPMQIEFPVKPTSYVAAFNGFVKSFPTPQLTPDDALLSEVSIRVVGTVTLAPSVLPPDYTRTGGAGDRRAMITVTSDYSHGSRMDALVNGTQANEFFFGTDPVAGKFILFAFDYRYVIDEAKWYQSAADAHGTWRWQGSNDLSTWVNIGSPFVLGGAALQTQAALNGNTTEYQYYRLLGVSGNASNSGYAREIEFRISPPYNRTAATGWVTGDRRAAITFTKSGIGSADNTILDGAYGNAFWAGGDVAGWWMQFDFGTPKRIDGARWIASDEWGLGVWKWQYSDDGLAFTDAGASFPLNPLTGPANGATCNMYGMSSHQMPHRYWRLLGVSGTWNSSSYARECEFRQA